MGLPELLTPEEKREQVFAMMTSEVRELNIAKGWREVKNSFAEYVALAHSELSEALEGWRNKDMDNVAEELADVLIRLFDMADVYEIDLAEAYRQKMDKNWQRSYQHGGKTL
jgi:NTP pyrophosphatase (non-canonical NTP hydrolase)